MLLVLSALGAACGSSKTTGIAPADDFVGTWFDARGRPLANGANGGPLVLRASLGSTACGWSTAVVLDLAWPVGTRATPGSSSVREFVRDPDGVIAKDLASAFASRVTPPADARSTGFHHRIWQLWVADSDPSSVYVLGPAEAERWPAVAAPVRCSKAAAQ